MTWRSCEPTKQGPQRDVHQPDVSLQARAGTAAKGKKTSAVDIPWRSAFFLSAIGPAFLFNLPVVIILNATQIIFPHIFLDWLDAITLISSR